MHISRTGPHPPVLFGLAVFAAVVLLLGRGILLPRDSPAFSLENPAGIRVLLGEGFATPGIHQFSDGTMISCVIELTRASGVIRDAVAVDLEDGDLVDGMALEIIDKSGREVEVIRSWMPARQRLALGIALHPDRMSLEDWVTLPGIGEKMAFQIERDRQNFGDFGRFEALERVKGIGPAKLKVLQPFFDQDYN